jgi:hypothetical protein
MTLPGGGVASAPPVTPPVEMGTLSAAPPVTPASAVAPPTEAELRALPASLAGATAPPQAASTLSAPASPGSSFYFLDAAQAPPPPAAPALPLGDYGFHPDMLPDLGITAGPYDPRMDRRDFPIRS